MPACVAIGTLVSMLSRQSLQHKTKACICHTRRRNNQRTFEWLLTDHGTKEVEKLLKFSPTTMINLTTMAGIIDTPFKRAPNHRGRHTSGLS